MKGIDFGRCALGSCVAAAMLAGCGGSQPPDQRDGVPGTLLMQARARQASGSSGDLLYTSGTGAYSYEGVDIFMYPQGQLVTTFTTPYSTNGVEGICSDGDGDVFIDAYFDEAGSYTGYIFEYAHGGTTPIAVLDDQAPGYNYVPAGCSIDPTTGDLAVANMPLSQYTTGNIAIYRQAGGKPTLYTSAAFSRYNSVTYDSSGNLYVVGYHSRSGTVFAELPKGGSSLQTTRVRGKVSGDWIQWDGQGIALFGGWQTKKSPPVIFRISVSGSSGQVIGKTMFDGMINHAGGGFWLQDGTVIFPAGGSRKKGWELGFWNYPAGGEPTQILYTKQNHATVSTVSVGSSR
jgi:hypothetical protein